MVLSLLFLLACVMTIVCAISANLLSTAPAHVWEHVRAIARLIVVAGAGGSFARVAEGWIPTPDYVIFVTGCAIFSAAQVAREIERQHGERLHNRRKTDR